MCLMSLITALNSRPEAGLGPRRWGFLHFLMDGAPCTPSSMNTLSSHCGPTAQDPSGLDAYWGQGQ